MNTEQRNWRWIVPRGVTDPFGPRGEVIETSTDRRWLWHLEGFLAVNGTTDAHREMGRALHQYLGETCEHHWLDYEGDEFIGAHQQCLWCNVVEWTADA